MSLKVHFITEDFELKSCCLQTAFFPESHTAENIAEALREAVSAWGLDETCQVCITTDNAANMVKAADLNKWTRLQCFGHRLHLAVENAVKKDARIDRAVGVCKKLVSHFSHSWKASDALTKVQKELNLPSHLRMPNKMGFQTDDDQQDIRTAAGFNSGPVCRQEAAASNSNLARYRCPGICKQVTGPNAGFH